jgi:hypothetical protein
MTQPSVRYFYIRSEQGHIAACVAYLLQIKPDVGGTMDYAVATVHPGDVVSKERARVISTGRLAKRRQSLTISGDQRPIDRLVEEIASHYVDHSTLTPHAARKHDEELHSLHLSREVCRLAHHIHTTSTTSK